MGKWSLKTCGLLIQGATRLYIGSNTASDLSKVVEGGDFSCGLSGKGAAGAQDCNLGGRLDEVGV